MVHPGCVFRLAIMVVAHQDIAGSDLGGRLNSRRNALAAAAGGNAQLRLGVRCDPDPLASVMGERKTAAIDAAVEITTSLYHGAELFARSGAIAAVIADMIDPAETLMMGGPTYQILPPTDGGVFLSLTFRRDPAITVNQFRAWWLYQHGPLASSLLQPTLLAYDQVHVDSAASSAAAIAAGLRYDQFDAYDNLTWASADAFLESVNDAAIQRQLYEDEQGHLDNESNRAALMQFLHPNGA